jgi:hypothetical protein
MTKDRFNKLEKSGDLPATVKSAISKLNRFDHLEIGQARRLPPVSPGFTRRACAHCGQPNEQGRDICWACFKPLEGRTQDRYPNAGQEVHLVLDGMTYRENDPNLPPDIGRLIARIRVEGYSEKLLQRWREERKASGNKRGERVELFQGQRVNVLRMDGKLYRSDDPELPPEIKEIFGYVDSEGVTPSLMQHLRLYGTTVKYRPVTTPEPSDGDISFWDAARKAFEK